MNEQLLSLVTSYGVPALFGILAISALGAPFPVMFVLIAAGSFVAQGEMSLWQVLIFGSAGAVLGDQAGYALGRFGGRRFIERIASRFAFVNSLNRAEAFTNKWGGASIFLTRWLFTPLGSWLNLTSGIAGYPWPRFIVWDVLGEALWVVLYVKLGELFSGYVQGLSDIFGSLTWAMVGVIVAAALAWRLVRYFNVKGNSAVRAGGGKGRRGEEG